jgi:elongation factor P--beta-lysine ligase
LHSPEFTMLEWYRVAEDYTQLMQDCTDLMQLACAVAGSQTLRYRDLTCDPFAAPERLGVVEALERYAGIDLLASIHADGSTDPAPLARQMKGIALRVAEDDTWSDLLSRILVAKVEPHLGQGRPTILDRYPAAEAALARRMPGDARLAERFELYACGVELANGFGELTNAAEQRLRFDAEVLHLLPEELPVVRGLLQQQRYFANARELMITVQAEDPDPLQFPVPLDVIVYEPAFVAEVVPPLLYVADPFEGLTVGPCAPPL